VDTAAAVTGPLPDAGSARRRRITFFSGHRRFRLIVDQHGFILQRSTLIFGAAPLPASVRRGG
jgi:hypothetical protein